MIATKHGQMSIFNYQSKRFYSNKMNSKDSKLNKFIIVYILTSIAVWTPAAIAQDKREVPSRQAWNSICLTSALNSDGVNTPAGKQWGSSVDKAYAQASCTCRHEQVKDQKFMTFEDLVEAKQKCQKELANEKMNFVTKYVRIHLDNR